MTRQRHHSEYETRGEERHQLEGVLDAEGGARDKREDSVDEEELRRGRRLRINGNHLLNFTRQVSRILINLLHSRSFEIRRLSTVLNLNVYLI